jgi:GTPase SAR1 family protein
MLETKIMNIDDSTANPAVFIEQFVNQTQKNIFLTGKAGTGKTTLLKKIIETTYKRTIVAAPTGIAAINAGGITLHSLFGLPFGAFVPDRNFVNSGFGATAINSPQTLFRQVRLSDAKRQVLRSLELLIIDEVSMLRSDILDEIDAILRNVRKKPRHPFGGVQMLFIGDLLQLPPVVKNEEWSVLKNYYASPFFFDAQIIRQYPIAYFELEKVYRQLDQTYVDVLNRLRNNKLETADVERLNSYYKTSEELANDEAILLTTHNYKADQVNRERLDKLIGNARFYKANIKDEFAENSFPMERDLELKVGAKVMFTKNDHTGEKRYFNGKIGVIHSLTESNIEVICDGNPEPIIASRYVWENKKYSINESNAQLEEEVMGSFEHFPLRLAWAVTVHKSQGLTFDEAIIDVGQAFASGQVYVALSRLRSLEGLRLQTKIALSGIDVNHNVVAFSEQKLDLDAMNSLLDIEKLSYLRDYLINAFDFDELFDAIQAYAWTPIQISEIANDLIPNWVNTFKENFINKRASAQKFRSLLQQNLASLSPETFDWVKTKTLAGSQFYITYLKDTTDHIFTLISALQSEKRTKDVCKSLKILEAMFYDKRCDMLRNNAVIDIFLNTYSSEANKQVMKKIALTRQLELEQIILPGIEFQTQTSTKKKKSSPDFQMISPKKINSLDATKLGLEDKLSVDQIATKYQYATSTIESNIAKLVLLGECNGNDYITKELIDEVKKYYDTNENVKLGELKAEMKKEANYFELRVALAMVVAMKES